VVAIQLTRAAGPLSDLPALARRIEDLGYDAMWVGEVNAADAVVPATLGISNTGRLGVGTLLNIYTRSPTNAALASAGLGHLGGSRAAVVLGASSPLLVNRWNGIPYDRPASRLEDYLRFLRQALDGRRVSGPFRTFTSSGFALDDPPASPPRLLVAAAMPRSLRLAAEAADGVVLNWLAPADLPRVEHLTSRPEQTWLSVVVCPTDDGEAAARVLRPLMTDYLSAPAYAGLQHQAGRGDALAPVWERFAAGDRAGAQSRLPTSVIDELSCQGTPQECGTALRRIERDHGIHVIATVYLAEGQSYESVLAGMAG
jgi:probable F420-dependent oxidoreductase